MLNTIKVKLNELTGNKYKVLVSVGMGWATEKFSLLTKILSLI